MNWDQISDLMAKHKGVSKKVALELLAGLESDGVHAVSEAHLMEMTGKIDQHPDDYESACNCDTCRSYE